VSKLSQEEYERLTAAVRSQDHLQRLVDEIEHLHHVVFHANERADFSLARQSAEQILIAEMLLRHQGRPEGLYYVLRSMEDAGKPWAVAIAELAAAIHSYFTTPLGIVMRKDLFGEKAVFIAPDAHEWTAFVASQPGGERPS